MRGGFLSRHRGAIGNSTCEAFRKAGYAALSKHPIERPFDDKLFRVLLLLLDGKRRACENLIGALGLRDCAAWFKMKSKVLLKNPSMEVPTMLDVIFPLAIVIALAWAIARSIKSAANKYPPAAPEQCNVSGVGGWLLLLVLGFMFLGPFMGAGRINADFLSLEGQHPKLKSVAEWTTYKAATWWTFLLVCCLSFYAGLGLVRDRNMSAVKRAKITLWIIGPIASLLLGILLPILIFGKFDPDPQFIGGMCASIIAAGIWTAYLSKSKRVKATYGFKKGEKSGKNN